MMTTHPELKITESVSASYLKEGRQFLEKMSWVFFVRNFFIGLLVIGVSLLSPNMFFCSISAVGASLFFSVFTRLDEKSFSPASIYNPYLTGMAVGAFYKFNLTVFLLCGASGVLTLLFNIILEKKLSSLKLPVLSLPFALVSTGVSATLAFYNGLFSLEYYGLALPEIDYFPLAVSAFLESVGSIIFMPNNVCGLILFIALVLISRVVTVHAVFGFFAGLMFKAALTGNLVEACNSFESFNWTLTGIAFGAFTTRAGAKSFFLSAVAVGICVFSGSVIIAAASSFNAIVYTLPFNLTVILTLAALRTGGADYFPQFIGSTPEMTMVEEMNASQRFKKSEASILLPFTGECKVYQGFNGPWTHNSKWQHAVDFIRVNEFGKMFFGSGEQLADYYTYGMPVLSPGSGWVVSCRHDIYDNEPGKVNHADNWGNYVITRTVEGVFIEVSHLKQFALLVKTGDYVVAGQVIGECGNSGLSAFPHLHVQVQKNGWLGEETLPFNFAVCQKGSEVVYNSVPEEGEMIMNPPFHLYSDNFIFGSLNSKWYLKDTDSGKYFEINVRRTQDIYGTFYLEDQEENKLFFSNTGGSYRSISYTGSFHSPLRFLFLCLPSLPFIANERYSWREKIPLNVYHRGMKSQLKAFIASTFGKIKLPGGKWEFNNQIVSGEMGDDRTLLELNPDNKLKEFSVNGHRFERRSYPI